MRPSAPSALSTHMYTPTDEHDRRTSGDTVLHSLAELGQAAVSALVRHLQHTIAVVAVDDTDPLRLQCAVEFSAISGQPPAVFAIAVPRADVEITDGIAARNLLVEGDAGVLIHLAHHVPLDATSVEYMIRTLAYTLADMSSARRARFIEHGYAVTVVRRTASAFRGDLAWWPVALYDPVRGTTVAVGMH